MEEETFVFFDDVFAHIAALFPAEYIHIGAGDVPKDQWKQSARVQARMRELGIINESRLQRYFFERISGVASGYEVIVSSAEQLSFNRPQSSGRRADAGEIVSLGDVYRFDPAPAALSAQDRSRLIGVQANVWTRRDGNEEEIESLTFPRAAALAEIGWVHSIRLHWPDFQPRMAAMLGRYSRLGGEPLSRATSINVSADIAGDRM
ncbi:MAG TPA: family 20 glycosylhydrolase [Steroidobacter sp.]|uniref:family 20 glycosylhydrolase n=1 Tax=Steroidobacter sp. TaxID=1978227 RepID=UPI002ED84AD6